MYAVNGWPPMRTSTRRSASWRTSSTRFSATREVCAKVGTAAAQATPSASNDENLIVVIIRYSVRALNHRGHRGHRGKAFLCVLGVLCGSMFSNGRQTRQHAAHVRERLLHPRQRILGVDLVFEIDVARVPHLL